MGPGYGAGFTLYQTKMEPETDLQKLGFEVQGLGL